MKQGYTTANSKNSFGKTTVANIISSVKEDNIFSKNRKAVKHMMVALFGFAFLSFSQISNGQTTLTYNASTTFTVPTGVTSITVACWGGGGGGGEESIAKDVGGGGGGGAYASSVVTVTPGSTYTITVGSGGAYNSQAAGSTGGSSSFTLGGTTYVLAVGGVGGNINGTGGGAGGAAASCTGTTTHSGGAGAAGTNSASSGGGGGAAGSTANGGAASGVTAGSGGATGGGAGAAGTSTRGSAGNPGNTPGGGGSGSYASSSNVYVAGAGGVGQVTLTYTTPTCSTPSAPSALNLASPFSGVVSGTFTAPASAPTNYLIIRTTSSTAPTVPTNATTYATGSSSLGGYIVCNTVVPGFIDNTSLTSGIQYWYWIYSYNTSATQCSGGPIYSTTNLNGSATVGSTTATTLTETTAGAGSITIPAGITSMIVQTWGGGGGGGISTILSSSSTGGGGGAYAASVIPVTPGSTYYYSVGAAGAAGTSSSPTGGTGGTSWANSTNSSSGAPTLAVGGSGGIQSTTQVGMGGAATACTSNAGQFSGGNGGLNPTSSTSTYEGGGGGGGSAANNLNGNTGGNGAASAGAGATAVTGGGAGGAGGYEAAASAGSQPGGGGGGSDNDAGTDAAGAGGTGKIIFTYALLPCAAPSAPLAITPGAITTTTIPGTITAPTTAPTGYIVIISTSASLSAGPVNGTVYTAGTALGGGTVEYVNTSTSFTASTSLSSNTSYNIFVYCYNNTACSGGPVYSITSATNTATTLPLAPTIGTATAGNASASVAFTGVSGSASVTYTATSTPGSFTGTGSSSPITVNGLTNGTAYTFTVIASNAGGPGAASAASNSVTPSAPCTTPGVATGLNLISPYSGLVSGSFTAPGTAPTGYLVIRTTTSSAPTTPVSGTTYTAGSSALGGYIVAVTTATGFTDNSGLTGGTPYWYWVYSYNSGSCSGGPLYSSSLNGSITVNSNPSTTINFTSSTTWTVPPGVTSITVNSWGGGGGGGGGNDGCSAQGTGSGGGGGGFAQSTIAVTPGQVYTLSVGAGGTAGAYDANGTAGGATSFSGNGITPVTATGGGFGTGASGCTTIAGGAGGTGTSGTVLFTGGAGSEGISASGITGVGGGGAGSGSNGSTPANTCSGVGTGGTGTYPGGAGGGNADCGTHTDNSGAAGTLPGGGGGGGLGYLSNTSTGGAGGGGEITIVYALSPCTTPGAPTGFTAGTQTNTTAPGSFSAPSSGASTYLVLYNTTGTTPTAPVNGTTYAVGNTSLGGTVIAVSGNTFSPTGLTANTTYYFWIYSENTVCTGTPFYSTIALTGNITTCAGAPAIGTATGVSPTGFTANWTAPTGGSAGAITYTIDVSQTSGSFGTGNDIFGPVTTSSLSQVVTGLTSGTPYYYQITASNGTCGNSSTSSVTLTCVAPTDQPTSLVLSPAATYVNGSFTASVTGTSYLVVRTTSATAPTNPVNGTSYTAGASGLGGTIVYSGPLTTFQDNGLTVNTPYWYWIFSYNNTSCTGGPLYYTTLPLTSSITTQLQKIWVGAGSSSTATGTDFNTAANWNPAVSPATGDNLVMNLVYSATAPSITFSSGSSSVQVNSLSITYSGTFSATKTATITIPNGYSLETTGNLSMSNSASSKVGTLIFGVASGGSLSVDGNLSLANSGSVANKTFVSNSGTTTVSGTSILNNTSSSSSSYTQFEVATGATSTFISDVTLDQGTENSPISTDPVEMGGTASGQTGTIIFQGNLNLGEWAETNSNTTATTFVFDGTTSQNINDNLYEFFFNPGILKVGSANTPSVTLVSSPYSYGYLNNSGKDYLVEPYANLTIGAGATPANDASLSKMVTTVLTGVPV